MIYLLTINQTNQSKTRPRVDKGKPKELFKLKDLGPGLHNILILAFSFKTMNVCLHSWYRSVSEILTFMEDVSLMPSSSEIESRKKCWCNISQPRNFSMTGDMRKVVVTRLAARSSRVMVPPVMMAWARVNILLKIRIRKTCGCFSSHKIFSPCLGPPLGFLLALGIMDTGSRVRIRLCLVILVNLGRHFIF